MDITFISVIEPKINWGNAISLLIHSLRKRGGVYSKSNFIIKIISEKNHPEHYIDNNIKICFVKRVQLYPTLNKLNLIETTLNSYQILLDHDIIILSLNGLQLYLNNKIYASKNLKAKLRFSLGNGYQAVMSRIAKKDWRYINYYNAGVIIVPPEYNIELKNNWEKTAVGLSKEYEMFNYIGKAPFGNLSFSLALALTSLPNENLPNTFNQRNWKVLPVLPNILHYNNYDSENIYIKNVLLFSFDEFKNYLLQTKNKYWLKYGSSVLTLFDSELIELNMKITAVINECN